jgi:Uma2 family endonuclease
MIAVADEAAIRARMHPISVETYHRLGEMGHLSERTELIRGVIIDQMPKSPLHSSIVQKLGRYLVRTIPPGYHVRSEQPLTFPESEPEPDVAAVAGEIEDFEKAHPRTAAFVIEVCVTSEELNRVKLGVYAAAGVAEAWLVLAAERVVERHTEPQGATYRRVERAAFPSGLPSTVFPAITLPPAGLFPG